MTAQQPPQDQGPTVDSRSKRQSVAPRGADFPGTGPPGREGAHVIDWAQHAALLDTVVPARPSPLIALLSVLIAATRHRR